VVSPDDLKKLMDDADRGSNATLSIDLPNQEIKGPDGGTVTFDIDPFRKHCLLNGLDDIALSLEKVSSIDSFEKKQASARPWL
jgi:3-isopropylmalate/(R)-2-methylmalate dehydratase small subunit